MIAETDKKKSVKIQADDKVTISCYKRKSMDIRKGKAHYTLDVNRYDINTLMMLLDINKISRLGEKFNKYGEKGVEKEEFIKLMKNELPTNPNEPMDELNLVYGLYMLFCEIDFNGDEHMQWEEFTQFIIDTVQGESEVKAGGDEEELINIGKNLSEKQMIKYKRYSISSHIQDMTNHKKDIIDAIFLPKFDKLLICEYGCKSLRIYNPKTGRYEGVFDLEEYLSQQIINASKLQMKEEDEKNKKKKIREEKPSVAFSILSACTSPWNVIALCLSNNKIMFFSFSPDSRGEFKYEIKTPSLQKRVWFLPEHNIWFSSGKKVDNEKFYFLNELDVEFEYKNSKLECYFNKDKAYRNSYSEISEHRGEILDVIEIRKPMLVLTACMDGIIRLINLNDKDFVKFWKYHQSGVRSLDYNPNIETVGYIMSTGFEYFINIYCTDLSLDDPFKGKLEGHYAPVIMCKFLSGSYMCVSVDEEGNVRIWDTKLKLCLQLIQPQKKNFKVTRLLCLPKYNKFIVYGNKMVFFDANYREEDVKQTNQTREDNYPIKVDFNKYYMTFYVTTLQDIHVYSSIDGSRIKTFKKFREDENFDPEAKIKFFTFEDRHRKFYLGFSNGAVHQFNAGNGSKIKPVNEYEIEKDGIQTIKYHHIKEVSSLYYYYNYGENENNNFILITTGLDSMINIYNEKNPEMSQKLRFIRGGHTIKDKVNDILCMDFSMKLNLFATGSANGLVIVWDFEMSKIDDVCFLKNAPDEKIDLFTLKFLDPFPILVASYSDGSNYFWGVKPNLRYRGECFLGCRNYVFNGGRIETSPVYTSLFIHEDMDEIPHGVLLRKEFVEEKPKRQILDRRASSKKMIFNFPSIEDKDNQNQENEQPNIIYFKEDYIDLIDPEINPAIYDNTRRKSYLIFGDNQGYIKIFDMRGIIQKYEFEKAAPVVIKSNFNILKKEDINVESILAYHLQKVKDLPEKFTNMYYHVLVREFQAHDDAITNLTKIEEPFCMASCSKDKRVKIWNFQCEPIGEINTQPSLFRIDSPCEWNFKVDWEKLNQQKIEEVIRLYETCEDVIQPQSEENLQSSEQADLSEIEERVEEKIKKLFKTAVTKRHMRYKPIEVKKEGNIYTNGDEGKTNTSHERLYLQELTKKIKDMISPVGPEIGMNEMSKTAMNSILYKTKNSTPPKCAKIKNEKRETSANSQTKKRLLQLSRIKGEKHIKIQPNFRETFYADKLLQKIGQKANKSKLLLPLLNNEMMKNTEKILFKKGETEKILSFEYYANSYNACCQIKRRSDVPNEALRTNYKTMWNYVDEYASTCKKKFRSDSISRENRAKTADKKI